MKKSLILAAAVLFAFGAGCSSAQPSNNASNSQLPSPQTNSQAVAGQAYSLAEVAQHATASDCWMAIGGKVYNATSFIPNHPGGDRVLAGCGKDATSLFEGIKGGRGHSQNAVDIMQTLYIGDLKQ